MNKFLNWFKSLFKKPVAAGAKRPARYSKNAWSYRAANKPTPAMALFLTLGGAK